jgi:truncated hemoglobin YjbI
MKTVRKVVQYLQEDVYTRTGSLETHMVPHHLSVEQATEVLTQVLKALNAILSREEMKDLYVHLERVRDALQSSKDIDLAAIGRLVIHEV